VLYFHCTKCDADIDVSETYEIETYPPVRKCGRCDGSVEERDSEAIAREVTTLREYVGILEDLFTRLGGTCREVAERSDEIAATAANALALRVYSSTDGAAPPRHDEGETP
jgi:hypothetical protein